MPYAMMNLGEIKLGRYEIVDLLPGGGQAHVAKAIDQQTQETVVIRQLATPPESSEYEQEQKRFARSGQIHVVHPGIVNPTECVKGADGWVMVMPFINGVDLDTYVAQNGCRLDLDVIVRIVGQITDALAAIHRQGIVHRDIKPANILIDDQGHPHLIDFGICKILNEPTITRGDGFLGSLPWASPEQVMPGATVDHRSDFYSVGAILYFLLTKDVPTNGNTPTEIMLSICQDIPVPPRQLNPSVPANLDSVCMRLLEKDPNQRFRTADELTKVLGGQAFLKIEPSACPSCGRPTTDSARFCMNCGAEFGSTCSARVFCIACGSAIDDSSSCSHCQRIFSPSDHRFVFVSGALTGKTFRVPEGIYEIGREQLARREQHISRRHVRIACTNGTIFVQDAGSANKTYVGGCLADHPVPIGPDQDLVIAGNIAKCISN